MGYPDGSSKQVDLDGTGVIIAKDGTRTDFTYGGDAKFEADRMAADKRPLDESEENVDLLNDPLGAAADLTNQVPGVGAASSVVGKTKRCLESTVKGGKNRICD